MPDLVTSMSIIPTKMAAYFKKIEQIHTHLAKFVKMCILLVRSPGQVKVIKLRMLMTTSSKPNKQKMVD